MSTHNTIPQILKEFSVQTTGTYAEVNIPQERINEVVSSIYEDEKYSLLTVYAEHISGHVFTINYVFGLIGSQHFLTVSTQASSDGKFVSLGAQHRVFAGYENEIMTMFGLIPTGHPGARNTVIHANWPKGIYPLRKDIKWNDRPKMIDDFSYPFFEVKGEGMYQIPVGPVHAGIIEPGHFVFSVLGEEIQQLDAQLGYVHKGVEKLFENLEKEKHLQLAEHISGDSTVSHALAYAQAIESIQGMTVPERATYLRVIYAELERVANHLNDIGFIMLDTAFAFGGANGARLREQVMQIAEMLTNSRFMRKTIIIGGVSHDISEEQLKELSEKLKNIEKDFNEVIRIAEKSITLANRVENTGRLTSQIAKDYGVVGVPLRALGVIRDARKDFPYAAYVKLDFSVATRTQGDVSARMWVKIYEVYNSITLIRSAIEQIPKGPIATHHTAELKPHSVGVGVVEGWRGDIVYVVKTDTKGHITRVKVRDPSFLNWQAFPHVVEGEMVPDFPLCNKSFNLSYTGNDL